LFDGKNVAVDGQNLFPVLPDIDFAYSHFKIGQLAEKPVGFRFRFYLADHTDLRSSYSAPEALLSIGDAREVMFGYNRAVPERPKIEPIRNPTLFEHARELANSIKVDRPYSEPALLLGAFRSRERLLASGLLELIGTVRRREKAAIA
jgi:hypothetical protein